MTNSDAIKILEREKDSGITNKNIAIDRAIKALEQTSGWISVYDQLPEPYQECLVIDEKGNYGIGFYRKNIKAWDHPNWGFLERADKVNNHESFIVPCGIYKVIGWMSLPEWYGCDNLDQLIFKVNQIGE